VVGPRPSGSPLCRRALHLRAQDRRRRSFGAIGNGRTEAGRRQRRERLGRQERRHSTVRSDPGDAIDRRGRGSHERGQDRPAAYLGRSATGDTALDPRRLLGEALGRTLRVQADPPALAPAQAHGPSARRQVPDLEDASAVPGRSDPAARTARHVGRRLDEHPELAVLFGLGVHHEALHPEQRVRVTTTVIRALCPPFSLVSTARTGGAGRLLVDAYGRVTVWHRPTLDREEPGKSPGPDAHRFPDPSPLALHHARGRERLALMPALDDDAAAASCHRRVPSLKFVQLDRKEDRHAPTSLSGRPRHPVGWSSPLSLHLSFASNCALRTAVSNATRNSTQRDPWLAHVGPPSRRTSVHAAAHRRT
jgi:hypothetical protein